MRYKFFPYCLFFDSYRKYREHFFSGRIFFVVADRCEKYSFPANGQSAYLSVILVCGSDLNLGCRYEFTYQQYGDACKTIQFGSVNRRF